MTNFPIDIPTEDEVIIVNPRIEDTFEFRLALDTAATHTTIDSNVLFLSGYELKNSKGEFETETSNGIILVEVYELKKFECLGIEREGFDVQVYDFLAHGTTSNYDGIVGLDWLR